jgi:predicted phosphodiesterase
VPYLILSDIHANLEALDAVLRDARGRYDRILCLGDLVDYGADPKAIVEWARANVPVIIRGNHDKACCSDDPLENYHPAARASAMWTRGVLSPDHISYIERLPRGPLRYEDFDLVHGSPADEDEYMITPSDAENAREAIGAPLTFFGHTHLQGGFLVTRRGVRRIAPDGILELEPDHYYLINPGSVGQPRDGDPRAAYALYSPAEHTVEYRRVDYDIEKAADKIQAAGLPQQLAARLFVGV